MSIAGHMRQAEACREMLQDEAKRIADSTEARVWLNKNVGSAPAEECLKVALRCVGDLTGDYSALKKGTVRWEEDAYDYRNPVENDYRKTEDCGSKMLECPDCKCRIQLNPFTYAVGDLGFSFCPYCGKDRRKAKT